jgi:hypothetical protein
LIDEEAGDGGSDPLPMRGQIVVDGSLGEQPLDATSGEAPNESECLPPAHTAFLLSAEASVQRVKGVIAGKRQFGGAAEGLKSREPMKTRIGGIRRGKAPSC